MNVHIIRTDDVKEELVNDVVEILNSVPGPVKYLRGEGYIYERSLMPLRRKVDRDTFNEILFRVKKTTFSSKRRLPNFQKVVSWESLFGACQEYREEYDIGDDEFMVLLTGLSNKKNWFSAFEPDRRRDAFIQTSLWEFYIPGENTYPVTFEIVANVLQSRMFKSYAELVEKTHHEPVGCMNDINKDKRHITFKLRTGDICEDCQQIITKRKIDVMHVQQAFSIFNKIRSEMMYLQRFNSKLAPGKMIIDMLKKLLIFPDYKDAEVKLTPLEMTAYLILIKHENGITFPEFTDYQSEMEALYKELTNTASLVDLKNNIENLAWNNDGSLSQKISNINRKITKKLGTEVSKFYRINGGASEARVIAVNRDLVSIWE